jgi:hypothetical protein
VEAKGDFSNHVTARGISVASPVSTKQERKMGDYLRHPIFFAVCVAGGLVLVFFSRGFLGTSFVAFGLHGLKVDQQITRDNLGFEHEKFLREWDEIARETDHKRQLEMLEALDKRRELTLPAKPDEGY